MAAEKKSKLPLFLAVGLLALSFLGGKVDIDIDWKKIIPVIVNPDAPDEPEPEPKPEPDEPKPAPEPLVPAPSPVLQGTVAPIVSVVKASPLAPEAKMKASAIWGGAADVLQTLDRPDLMSTQLSSFTQELMLVYTQRHPELRGGFPGLDAALLSAFGQVLPGGNEARPVDAATKMKVVEFYRALQWAFMEGADGT